LLSNSVNKLNKLIIRQRISIIILVGVQIEGIQDYEDFWEHSVLSLKAWMDHRKGAHQLVKDINCCIFYSSAWVHHDWHDEAGDAVFLIHLDAFFDTLEVVLKLLHRLRV
jgi:hypothetical protein